MRLPRLRLRFSIRWLLVLIAATATLCYVLFVRPTVMSYRFVNAIEHRDYAAAVSLLRLDTYPYSGRLPPLNHTESIDYAYAEVLPRDWSDIWAMQRRLILRVRRHDDRDARYIEWTEDWDVVAHINGLEIVVMNADSVRFNAKGYGLRTNASSRQRDGAAENID
ncbi:MAG TPA: hypothetical protein VGK58_01725 [Lacipirellulaceae bacterium]